MAGFSAPVVNIADLRELVRRRLARAVFDYIDGGAEAELTLRDYCRAFKQVLFRRRCAVPVRECNLHTSVLDDTLELPF